MKCKINLLYFHGGFDGRIIIEKIGKYGASLQNSPIENGWFFLEVNPARGSSPFWIAF